MNTKSTYPPEFKTRLVIEILTGEIDYTQVSLKYGIQTDVVMQWEQEFLEKFPSLIGSADQTSGKIHERLTRLEQRVEKLSNEIELAMQTIAYIKTLDEINQEKYTMG